jgi:hypothetical protein
VTRFDREIVGRIVNAKTLRGVGHVFKEPPDAYFFRGFGSPGSEEGHERREGGAQFATNLPAMVRCVRDDVIELRLLHGTEGYIIVRCQAARLDPARAPR